MATPGDVRDRPGDVRDRLVEAAVDVLAEDGLAGFTHRRIEDRAGASHGSTTYYFGTRDGLYAAALERVLQIEAQLSADAVAEVFGIADGDAMLGHSIPAEVDWTGPEGLDLLRRFAEASIRRLMDSTRTCKARFEIYLHAARTPGGRAELTAARQRIYAAQAEQAAILGYPDPELYSRTLPAVIDGLLIHHLAVPDQIIEARAVDAILATIAGLYACPAPGQRQFGDREHPTGTGG